MSLLEFFLDREAGKTACQLFAKYRDIEDSCQFQAAKKAGCKVLIKKTNKGTARPMSSDAFLLRSTIMFFCPYYLHRGQKRNLEKLVFQRMLVNEPSVEISSIMLVIST